MGFMVDMDHMTIAGIETPDDFWWYSLELYFVTKNYVDFTCSGYPN